MPEASLASVLFVGEGSKTEALYIPPPRKEPYTEEELSAETADIAIDEDRFISYTDEFKYLGSILQQMLDDKVDIDARIKQAKGQFQAMRKNVFTSKEIPLSERLRCYLGKTLSPSIQYFGGARAGRSKFL